MEIAIGAKACAKASERTQRGGSGSCRPGYETRRLFLAPVARFLASGFWIEFSPTNMSLAGC
jgi:hypothetical protein